MAVNPSPFGPKPQFELSDGTPAIGNQIFFYVAGSVGTKQNTYTDSTGGSANTNPLVLNSLGQPTTQIWFTAGQSYKVVYAPSTDTDPPTSPIWTIDNLTGINDSTNAASEWVAGPAPTFVSGTSFTLVGDQTTTFHIGRRVKTTNTSGTIYSTITNAVFGVVTTLTVENDSGNLDAGLSAVSYGLLSQANGSAPAFTDQAPVVVNRADRTKRVRISVSGVTTGKTRIATMSDSDVTLGLPQKHISGLTYSNNAGDATNDIDIAVGKARDATDAVDMVLASTLTKQSDAVWAVGSAAGGLDLIASAGNNDFYIWLIKRSDTGVVDALYSLSSTAPTMPLNYDYKRLIGWMKRTGGTIVAFTTYETEGGGLELRWNVPTLDISLANTLTTARRTDAVKVPLAFSVIADLNVLLEDAGAGNTLNWIYCPDQTDAAPSGTVAPLTNFSTEVAANNTGRQLSVRTSATGTIAARSNVATIDLYDVVTSGFRWARRN